LRRRFDVQFLQASGRGINHALADVRDAVADAFEVVRGKEEIERAGDRARLLTRDGLFSRSDYYPIKRIAVQ